jgi:hypothetical protein
VLRTEQPFRALFGAPARRARLEFAHPLSLVTATDL